ncbi:MAG: M1 family metallopeptidase [Williamsia sp.]|nr:M1 family metallopeptidase [Williamsia sp.]
MKRFFFCLLALGVAGVYAQSGDSTGAAPAWTKIYRATATKINDLVDTKLDVKFDYDNAWLYGKEWVTIHPHFYPTDSLTLDAHSMDIKEVALVKGSSKTPLKFTYDSSQLFIKLNKTYQKGENYTVYIDYISRPNTIKAKGSAAITDNKGLYFINPKGEDKKKPIQIWTQGETESNSGWFPTIDKPNQKTTEQITMTVPAKYVTLSNGLLVSKKANADGTRTDVWKMDLPHSPYLFFMGVGDYAVIKDSYKGKEVSYYVEKEYAPVARKIFGYTPEMIAFFSKITGVDYPWAKYAQITGRDYVSGAMENTTATLHGASAQQDARELKDGNRWESVIAHELFHQWFGDYATTESWSNITLNESFADYSETLWATYKHGRDEGDATINANLRSYLANPESAEKPLVRFYYNDKEDVFDDVSYPKGGCILHMLRNYVGDSAFFKALNLYLNTYKFSNAEAQQLRLAFEGVTGQDLNWFWNQWYYGAGHPKLTITYGYDEGGKKATITIKQTGEGQIFTLPFAIDVYERGSKKRYNVWMKDSVATYTFPVSARPELVNVDGDKVLLCEKTENKTGAEYAYQYAHAGLYRDRREAIAYALNHQGDAASAGFLQTALKDPSYRLRLFAVSGLNAKNDTLMGALENTLAGLAKNDSSALVRAKAIELLGGRKKAEYTSIFRSAISDSSYSVAGAALQALGKTDSAAAVREAQKMMSQPAKGDLKFALIRYSDDSRFDEIWSDFDALSFGEQKFRMLAPFAEYLANVKNAANFKKGVDAIAGFRKSVPEQYRGFTDPAFTKALGGLEVKKRAAGEKELADYVKGAMQP